METVEENLRKPFDDTDLLLERELRRLDDGYLQFSEPIDKNTDLDRVVRQLADGAHQPRRSQNSGPQFTR